MQIERQATQINALAPTERAYCALDCVDCTGLCLSVYFMLTQAERNAISNGAGGFGVRPQMPVGRC